MICTGCRRTLLARISTLQSPSSSIKLTQRALPQSRTSIRTIATVPSTPNAAPSTPPQPTTNTDTAASSTTSSSTPGKSQPFSEPFFPSTITAKTPPTNPSTSTTPTSTIVGGTPLTPLVYTKPTNTSKPLVALEDHEYPTWLWSLVTDPNAPTTATLDGGVDVSTMTKRSRAKFERKQAKLMAGLEKPVPLHEQSRDLTGPGDDAVASAGIRKDLTKSMRGARRKEIREANFLRSM